jgi:hypothetical protein
MLDRHAHDHVDHRAVVDELPILVGELDLVRCPALA